MKRKSLKFVLKRYSWTLNKCNGVSLFPGVLLCYATINVGFSDAKYESLPICLRSKQNYCELLWGVSIYQGVLIYWWKNIHRSHFFPLNNGWWALFFPSKQWLESTFLGEYLFTVTMALLFQNIKVDFSPVLCLHRS